MDGSVGVKRKEVKSGKIKTEAVVKTASVWYSSKYDKLSSAGCGGIIFSIYRRYPAGLCVPGFLLQPECAGLAADAFGFRADED